VNAKHRISLSSNWKLSKYAEFQNQQRNSILAMRSFHCPTGLTEDQQVMLCFANLDSSTKIFWEDKCLESAIVDGSAIVSIRKLLQASNRIELRWQGGDFDEAPELPKCFSAWLEISEPSET
jgi:hypothetical protein